MNILETTIDSKRKIAILKKKNFASRQFVASPNFKRLHISKSFSLHVLTEVVQNLLEGS